MPQVTVRIPGAKKASLFNQVDAAETAEAEPVQSKQVPKHGQVTFTNVKQQGPVRVGFEDADGNWRVVNAYAKDSDAPDAPETPGAPELTEAERRAAAERTDLSVSTPTDLRPDEVRHPEAAPTDKATPTDGRDIQTMEVAPDHPASPDGRTAQVPVAKVKRTSAEEQEKPKRQKREKVETRAHTEKPADERKSAQPAVKEAKRDAKKIAKKATKEDDRPPEARDES